MQQERIILKNALFLGAGKIFGDLCAFLFLAFLSRSMGAEILGRYAVAMSVGGMIAIFVSLGANTIAVREVSKDNLRNGKYIGNLLLAQSGLSLLFLALLAAGLAAAGCSPPTRTIILLIATYHIFYILAELVRSGFMAHERMLYPAVLEFGHRAVILSLGSLAIVVTGNALLTLAVFPLSAAAMFLLALYLFIREYGRPQFSWDFGFLKTVIAKSAPMLTILILLHLNERLGILLLSVFRGDVDTGIFSASERMLSSFNALLLLLSSVLLPAMSRLSAMPRIMINKLFEQAMRVIIIVLLPVSFLVFFLSQPLITLTFGGEFAESVKVLQILIWSLTLVGLNHVSSYFLIALDLQRQVARIRVATGLLYLLASALLITRFGVIGLAWAKILLELSVLGTTMLYIHRAVHPVAFQKVFVGPMAAASLSILLFILMPGPAGWPALTATLLSYLPLLFIFRGILHHDLVSLKGILLSKSIS